MKPIVAVAIALLVPYWAPPSLAAALDSRFVNGLGEPVRDVRVVLSVWRSTGGDTGHSVELFQGTTDADGRVRMEWDEARVAPDEFPRVDATKKGYVQSTSALVAGYIMRKVARTSLADIVALPEGQRASVLREYLAGRPDGGDDLLALEDRLRGPLRELVEDEFVGRAAVDLLATIAERTDIDFIVAHRPAKATGGFENRWAYVVATALVTPETDAEWSFLDECASGAYDDGWVDAGAIMVLSLADPTRSASILQAAAERNEDRRDWIGGVLVHLGEVPADALQSRSVGDMPSRLGPLLGIGKFKGASNVRFNPAGNKAQASLTYRSGRDTLIYTATYARGPDGIWRLRSVRETAQYLGPILEKGEG